MYKIAVYKLLAVLDELADEFGRDVEGLRTQQPGGITLVNNVTRRDIPHAGLKIGSKSR